MKKLGKKVVYELYPLSFKDSNNDGVGDIRGIIEKLDYLHLLGIDLIWITPIFKSPKNDNGYDILNYCKIDPSFGKMSDVEELIAEAKKRNIGIMFDMVFNHVSTESEWFKEALDGSKKYQDYFYILKSSDKQNPPCNWVSKFGGPAWKYEDKLGGWYLCLYDKTQADLNWRNPEVRKELIKVMNFWITKGVRGFRFDVINVIGKSGEFVDSKDYGKSLYTDQPIVHEYLKEINNASFGHIEDFITVGEMSSTTIENCAKYSNPNEKELDMVFNFHHLKVDYKNGEKWENKPWDKKEFKQLFKDWQLGLANRGWNTVFLNNHDQPRVNSRYGDVKHYWFESSTMFATLVFTLQGTPFIYQGEEIGMTNPNFTSINEYKDVESINAYKELKQKGVDETQILEVLQVKSRDNSRTPMQWTSEKYAGFSSSKPWINVASNYEKINVESQINDPNSIFNFYRKLIQLRKTNEVLYDGEINFIETNENLFVYERKHKNQKLLIVLNLSDEKQSFVTNSKIKSVLSNNYSSLNLLEFAPYQAVILEIEN